MVATTRTQAARDFGKSIRKAFPRSNQGDFQPVDRDAVAILEAQNGDRVPSLIPVRMGRMLQSPFSFYRGTAAIMANDHGQQPHSGIQVVSCGDAHLSNFGTFASPERTLIFDLNDFDEASNAPWEWDVKRLATSALIGACDVGLREDQAIEAARSTARSYRETLSMLMQLTAIERYYYRGESSWLQQTLDAATQKLVNATVRKARSRTSDQILNKIVTTTANGEMRIVDEPPIMAHATEASLDGARSLVTDYQRSVRADIAVLMSQFELIDVVMRIVGVGSVGTRCFIMLLVGPSGEPLFLQAKEAVPSVLESHGGIPCDPPRQLVDIGPGFQGYRIISSQRILQSASDPFLGYLHTGGRDFYIRQFRDMKGSVDLTGLNAEQFVRYASLCGALLARAHAQSPNAAVVQGYLGQSDVFDEAVTRWATGYAAQAERDFAALGLAAKSGRIPVEMGV